MPGLIPESRERINNSGKINKLENCRSEPIFEIAGFKLVIKKKFSDSFSK